jgi:bifunctional DNA-binding transcriptional regulator/antitoxin component of YhaV-PrlF toxin-antitoxin module
LEKILGVSKVQPNNRITIIRKVQKKLNVNVGDVLMYIEDDKGNIMIKKVQLNQPNLP